MMSLLPELDRSNVVDVDLGSAEFKANAHRYMAEWARRRPFYVLGKGPPQVVVVRYADVHRVFSDTETFKSEMPRGAGWEQFNKIMFAQFVTQMDGEQHARVRRLLMPAFSSRRIEQLQDNITRIVDGMLDRIEANGPEFDGMQDYGAHLVVDALLDAMVNMDQRRKAIFVAFHDGSRAPPTSSRASRGRRLLARFPKAHLIDPGFTPVYGGAVGELRLQSLPMKTH